MSIRSADFLVRCLCSHQDKKETKSQDEREVGEENGLGGDFWLYCLGAQADRCPGNTKNMTSGCVQLVITLGAFPPHTRGEN